MFAGVQKDKDNLTKDNLDKTPEKGVSIDKGDTTSGKEKGTLKILLLVFSF